MARATSLGAHPLPPPTRERALGQEVREGPRSTLPAGSVITLRSAVAARLTLARVHDHAPEGEERARREQVDRLGRRRATRCAWREQHPEGSGQRFEQEWRRETERFAVDADLDLSVRAELEARGRPFEPSWEPLGMTGEQERGQASRCGWRPRRRRWLRRALLDRGEPWILGQRRGEAHRGCSRSTSRPRSSAPCRLARRSAGPAAAPRVRACPAACQLPSGAWRLDSPATGRSWRRARAWRC